MLPPKEQKTINSIHWSEWEQHLILEFLLVSSKRQMFQIRVFQIVTETCGRLVSVIQDMNND